MSPWSVSGAKSRQGQLQEGPRHSGLSILGAFLAESVASRVALGTLGISKMCEKNALLEARQAVGPPKMASGRGVGKNLDFL